MKFSHTSLSCWRRCKVQYNWKYKLNYATGSSPGMRRGSVGHAALAAWYKTQSKDAALKAASDCLAVYEHDDECVYQEDWDLMGLVISRCIDWSVLNDNFVPISVEQRFDINFDGNDLTGFIDAIVERRGQTYLMEHKFSKQASVKHISLDAQVSTYLLAATELGYKPSGVIYNVIRVAAGGIAEKEPVLRAIAFRNLEGLQIIKYEIGLQMREMDDFLKNGGNIYRSPTKDCSWDCSFYNACLSINDVGTAESVLKTYKKYEKVEKGEKEYDPESG